MANGRTRAQAARERTRDRRSTEERAAEIEHLREKRARQILLELTELRRQEDALSDELFELMGPKL